MKYRTIPVSRLAVVSGLLLITGLQSAYAAPDPLQTSIKNGQRIYAAETFGGNGKTCNSCHIGLGKTAGMLPNGKPLPSLANAGVIFPRTHMGKVVTLEGRVRQCVQGALQGEAPAYGSEQLVDLVTYISSLSNGKPLNMGGAPK